MDIQRRFSSTHFIAVTLFLLACVLGVLSQQQPRQAVQMPRAQYADSTPLGGKGLRLLLERLGYSTSATTKVLSEIPSEAKIWILLDPETRFSTREANQLLAWIKGGGTLIWAVSTPPKLRVSEGILHLRSELKTSKLLPSYQAPGDPLPPLFPLGKDAVSELWAGVSKAQTSRGILNIQRPHLALSQTKLGLQFAKIPYGKGQVFTVPDALMFTNYALSNPDNAVLATNLIRLHAPPGALVIFDERAHGESEVQTEKNWLYYLWQPPLRYALFQLGVAVLLGALLYGRRFGAPVPLPDGGPVTRASQFALAMGTLFQKAKRPQAASKILRENFRQRLTQRLGLSITDPDELIAQRAAELTDFSARDVLRLLQDSEAGGSETQALSDARKMDAILRSFNL